MNQQQSKNPAEMYEDYFVPAMFNPWATILLRHAAPQAGERVLDVACGTGIVARKAAPSVGLKGQVAALDMNPSMLAVARTLPIPTGAKVHWQEGNAMELPFPENSFDLVLCQHGLQFFPDRIRAVREMHRVLKPQGRALAIVLQHLAKHPVFETLMKSVATHLALPLTSVMTPFIISDPDELKNLFTSAGFKNIRIQHESTKVRFPDPQRFVSLAVASSAAAIPAFTQLGIHERAALLEAIRVDVEPIVSKYRDGDYVSFPMFANIAVAIR